MGIHYHAVLRRMPMHSILVTLIVIGLISLPAQAITLKDAEVIALENEPGGNSLVNQQRALEEMAIANAQLPDPRLQLGGLNLPTDSFDLDQEPMTQVRLGIKQEFPAGKSRSIHREHTLIESEILAYRASERRLSVRRDLRTAWFEVLYWQNAISLLKEDRALFEQLLQVTESLYRVGSRSQHDLARANLELGQLEDRILQAGRNLDIAIQAVERWTGYIGIADGIALEWSDLPEPDGPLEDLEQVAVQLTGHPLVQGMDARVQASEKSLALARETYKPAWELEVGYGFRSGQDPDMMDRSDFLTVLATIDLPVFRGNRQDKVASARAYEWAAAQDGYADTLRALTRDAISEYQRWMQVSSRLELYEQSILPQARLQAEATLQAYQADTTDFSELMRAWLSEQTISLDYQRLKTDEQQALARLLYLVPGETDMGGGDHE